MEKAAEVERQAIAEAQERRKDTREMVSLPFGRQRPAREYYEVRYPFKDQYEVLSKPEICLANPEPDKYRYAWPLKDDATTQARMRAGVYIKVLKKELRKDADVVTHEGTDDGVYWYRHVLVKVPLRYAERIWDDPARWALRRLARHEESTAERVEEESKGVATMQFESSKG